MSPKIQLPWPKLGLSDDVNAAEQPPLTSPLAKNVRLLDARTGRSRGGQRAGSKGFFTQNGKTQTLGIRIEHVAAISYNQPKIEYLFEEIAPTVDWSEPVESPVVALETDRAGNIYALLADGRVQIWNPDQKTLDTILPPLDRQEVVASTLAVDEARRVYVVASKADEDGGGSVSRLFMFRLVVDPDDETLVYYDTGWIQELDGRARFLVAKGGAVWVCHDFTDGEETAIISKFGGVGSVEPVFEWKINAPYPVSAIAVNSTGEVYSVSPFNAARGTIPDTEGLHKPLMSWTVHDLGYEGTVTEDPNLSDNNRLHAWLSADSVPPGTAHGQPIDQLGDRRYVQTRNTNPPNGQAPGSTSNPAEYDTGPNDGVIRNLFKSGNRDAPKYWKYAFAGTGGVVFDPTVGGDFPGTALRSRQNTSQYFKSDTEPTTSLDTDTDSVDHDLTSTFETFAGLLNSNVPAAGLGVGTVTIDVTFAFSVTQGSNTEYIVLRAVKDPGNVDGEESFGAEVRILPGFPQGSKVSTLTLPSTAPNDTTSLAPARNYGIDWLAEDNTGMVVTIEGFTTRVTVSSVKHTEGLPDKEGVNLGQKAVIPGNYAFAGWGDQWTHISTWQIAGTTEMRMMAWQNGDVHKWALIANARISNGILSNKTGWITFLSNRMVGGESQQFQMPGLGGGTFDTYRGVSGSSRIDGTNTAGYAIVTIQATGVTGNNTGTNLSFFRVNGTPAGYFSFEDTSCWGPTSMVVVGCKTVGVLPSVGVDLFGDDVPFEPFQGKMSDFCTVLGRTTTDTQANGNPTTFPADTTTGLPPKQGEASGTTSQAAWDNTPPTNPTSYTIKATEVERLEGGFAHARGMGNYLPNGIGGQGTGGLWNDHPFGGVAFPPTGFAADVPINKTDQVLLSPDPLVAKIGANGSGFIWAFAGSGVGGGVTALPGRFLATAGERLASDAGDDKSTGTTNIVARKIFDGGNTYSTATADGAWTHDQPTSLFSTGESVDIISDDIGNVYLPLFPFEKIQFLQGDTGAIRWEYSPNTETGGNVRSLTLSTETPVYPLGYVDTDRVPIYLYAVGQNKLIEKLRQVTETQVIGDTASPRKTRYLSVAGRDLRQGPPGGISQIVGKNLFSQDKTFVAAAQLNTKLYYTDGLSYVEYDPVQDFGTTMKSAERGEMPKRARLLASWQGRLVMARTQDDDSTLYASAQNEPDNWDYDPPNPSAQTAWNSTLTVGTGGITDTITALISLDNILIVGCDTSIYKLVGDPRAGGRIELVSDETGIAFGSAWIKDPSDILYFFGQRGGVYAITRGLDSLVGVARIAEYQIERRLQNVDLSTHRVEMVWDYKNEGLHVLPIPYV